MTSRKANPQWPNNRPDIDTAVIAERYLSGESSKAIAVSLSCSQQTIIVRLAAAGVSIRAQGTIKRYAGGHHPNWKGDRANYFSLHQRVARARGAPQECGRCGLNDPSRKYHWANLTGRLADINDYARMCVSCHKRFDLARIRAVKAYAGSVVPVDEVLEEYGRLHREAKARAMADRQATVDALAATRGS